MKKLTKRVLTALLALAMILSMAACGSSKAPAEDETTNPDIPAGRTEVLMWSAVSGTIANCLQTAADNFNASQEKYYVNIQYQGDYTEIYTKLTTTINQSDLPDMAIVSTELVGTYALTEGLLCPLSNYCAPTDEVWAKLNGNLKAIWGDGEGNPLCYPYGNSFYGTFVNADIFEAAGIDPYTALTSAKGFYEACKKIVDGGYAEYGAGLDSWGGFVWYALAAAGIQFMNNNNGRDAIPTEVLIDTPEVKAALHDYFYYFQRMQEEGLIIPYGSAWGDEVLPAFAGGKAAMATGSIAAFGRVETASAETPFNLAWVPCWSAVDLGGAPEGYASSGTGFCIINSGDEEAMQGAFDFISTTANADNQQLLTTSVGYLPIDQAGYESAGYQDFVATRFPAAAKAFELQQSASTDSKHTNALNPINNACQSASGEAWSQIMSDTSADIDAVIDNMQSTLQEALDLWATTNS